ncbi:uncharacterized protein PAC_02236 [Phialocephala subalpina]|uniref:Uncharacterized protein n=1 Tax=Phialocephala subalpina TaxID=576137 RepID=A0A1L7WHW3_9HELO|nr:uncharacterized protein PAC_02236 [Phialocephala subalpina]
MYSHPPPTPPLPNEAKTSSPTLRISLKFLKWQALYETEKPFQIFINIPPDATDQRTTNLLYENVDLIAKDVRYIDFQTSLDKNGFIYCKHQTHIENFNNREYVDKHYLPEVEALLRSKVDDVDRIFFFDWRLRKNVPEVEGEVVDLNDRTTWLRPAMHVHIDQSPAAALKRVQLQLKEDAYFLLRGRVRIINVWRPLVNSVEDWPLAVCDGSTVNQNDLVEADHIRRHYMGSTMYLQHHESQQFYFMSKQSKDDVLIFKNFDSRKDVAANCKSDEL